MLQTQQFSLDKAISDIENSSSLNDLQNVKSKYLGKKGIITAMFKQIKDIPADKKKAFGKKVNKYKNEIEKQIEIKRQQLEEEKHKLKELSQKKDHTMPGAKREIGSLHLITQTLNEIQDIWVSMGFEVVTGPEIETPYYNFEALNTPEWHPARDMHDTFYVEENKLLRTHTSPVQVRTMENREPPIAIFSPGRCFRKDTPDMTHIPMFTQFEVLYVDREVSVAHLKGVLENFVKRILGERREVRLRPSFFPFTEPSFEVDVSCGICMGKGCRSCGGTGWVEILGAGIVHPNVLSNVGYDPEKWSGFALGTGVERIAMLKYNLSDIRDLLRNDKRFLESFRGVVE